jgi:hypothetical protein
MKQMEQDGLNQNMTNQKINYHPVVKGSFGTKPSYIHCLRNGHIVLMNMEYWWINIIGSLGRAFNNFLLVPSKVRVVGTLLKGR